MARLVDMYDARLPRLRWTVRRRLSRIGLGTSKRYPPFFPRDERWPWIVYQPLTPAK